ncbi:MAG: hypothetical protein LC104_19570 [Bacteroidales bacterium]|nr:hypothetical protein [Bacteroidales bacterium]
MVFLPFIIAGAITLFAVGVILYAVYAERVRTLALAELAEELGFDFEAESSSPLADELRALYLFQQGRQPRVRNHLHGTTTELDVSIFDYSYTLGSGKNRQVVTQTVVCFRAESLQLPAFTLRPESFWHRIGQLFGIKDIHFDSHPQFSRAFLLQGVDEEAIRAVFTESVLDFFENQRGICVEAHADILIYYRPQLRTDVVAVREFLAEGFDILSLFRSRATAT